MRFKRTAKQIRVLAVHIVVSVAMLTFTLPLEAKKPSAKSPAPKLVKTSTGTSAKTAATTTSAAAGPMVRARVGASSGTAAADPFLNQAVLQTAVGNGPSSSMIRLQQMQAGLGSLSQIISSVYPQSGSLGGRRSESLSRYRRERRERENDEVSSATWATSNFASGGDCASPLCFNPINGDDPTLGGRFPACKVISRLVNPSEVHPLCTSHREETLTTGAAVSELYSCLQQVRAVLPGQSEGSSGLRKAKIAIRELNSPQLQAFLALSLTSYCEGDSAFKVADFQAIQKVMANRLRRCQIDSERPYVTFWDVAIAPLQFSCFNSTEFARLNDPYLWNENDPQRMMKAIEGFATMQCAQFQPPGVWGVVDHYRATSMDRDPPDWARPADEVVGSSINSVSLTTAAPAHRFYALKWACTINYETPSSDSVVSNDRWHLPKALEKLGLLCLFPEKANAAIDEWEIMRYPEYGTYLRLKANPKQKVVLIASPAGGKLISVTRHPKHPHIELIEYDAGDHGTIVNLHLIQRVIYNTKTKKFLGNYPVSITAKDPKNKRTEQPKWSYDAHSIKIWTPEEDKTFVVKVK